MKKKQTNDSTRVKGFYINELIRGFFGEQNEGKVMLQKMGLSPDAVPFSVVIPEEKKVYEAFQRVGGI